MKRYERKNTDKSRYSPRLYEPYKALRDLYRRLGKNRYRPTRPVGGGSGGYRPQSANRPNMHRYSPSTQVEYKVRPSESRRSQVILRSGPVTRINFPRYRPEPDIEGLLRQLEKRFDEKLHERILEMMEREFDETRAELFSRYGLAESALDEDLQQKLERLQDPEKWEQQKKEQFVEISESMAEKDADPKPPEQNQEPVESTAESVDEASIEPSQDVEKAEVWMSRAELEATQNAPTRVIEKVDDDLYEVVETEPVKSSPPAETDSSSEAAVEPLPLEHAVEPIAAPIEPAQLIEATLDNPLFMSDIEALYNELEAEELEPEEEIEPGH
jgi:hypothetical protein